MKVERKNFWYRILAPILNWYGRSKGISGCLICGDNWNWKQAHYIEMRKGESAFPTCQECWDTCSDREILRAAEELGMTWKSHSRLLFLGQSIDQANLLMATTKVALLRRKKRS